MCLCVNAIMRSNTNITITLLNILTSIDCVYAKSREDAPDTAPDEDYAQGLEVTERPRISFRKSTRTQDVFTNDAILR